MGGAINSSFISKHVLLSTYFLTAQTYRNICLITQVYGIIVVVSSFRLLPKFQFIQQMACLSEKPKYKFSKDSYSDSCIFRTCASGYWYWKI